MRLQYFLFGIISLITVSVLSSCSAFEDPSKRATANAEDTAIAATISVVEFQNETMVALRQTADAGVALSQQMTQSAGNPVAANPNANNTDSSKGPVTTPQPTAFGGGNSGGNSPTSIPTPIPTSPPATAIYSYATTTDTLDNAFCALSDVTEFSVNADIVYFVIEVQNLKPGVVFSLRVRGADGGLPGRDDNFWTSDTLYESTCIYYGIDADTMPFEVGTYRAILLANGEEVIESTFYLLADE